MATEREFLEKLTVQNDRIIELLEGMQVRHCEGDKPLSYYAQANQEAKINKRGRPKGSKNRKKDKRFTGMK